MAQSWDLSPDLQKKAIEDLNEVPERRESDIEHIRDWLKKQPHLNARMGKPKEFLSNKN